MRSPSLLAVLALAAACGQHGSDADRPSESAVIGASRLNASDVTVLLPLTSLDAMTPRDGILPDDVAAQVGQLVEHYTADDTLARLRVVCARFDPCAPKPGGDRDACIAEVRMVLQPLLLTDGVLGAQDAAVHVFYDLADKRDLAARVAALPASTSPDHARALSATLHDLTAQGSLSRVTFLRNTDVKGNAWVFGGFDIHAGVSSPLVVPRTGGSEQHIVVNGSGPFASSLAPAPLGADTLGLLLDPIRLGILFDANPNSAKQQIDRGLSAAAALEDPARHDAATADCASCHLSESARTFGRSKLDGVAPARTFTAAETLRACGYVGTKAVLSQRTINESAIAAQRMGELLP